MRGWSRAHRGERLQEILREPTGCRLRTSAGDLLPVTTGKDSAGKNRLIAGDARVNEHAMLASMHTLWVREHNRLCDGLDGDESMTDDEKFALVRKVRPRACARSCAQSCGLRTATCSGRSVCTHHAAARQVAGHGACVQLWGVRQQRRCTDDATRWRGV